MQFSIQERPLQSAYSPSHKKQCIAGYPSPPSSGRNDQHDEGIQVDRTAEIQEEDFCPRYITNQHQGQLSAGKDEVDVEGRVNEEWEGSSDSDEDEEHESCVSEDEDSQIGEDVTITARSRSVSQASSSATVRSSGSYRQSPSPQAQEKRSPHIIGNTLKGPIRDTPRNPFLEGGPADVGHAGPYGRTRLSGMSSHSRERGKMTYVFRGQRVTYVDPYASDSDDDGSGSSAGGCMLDRLQPKLLFPSVGKPIQRRPPMDLATIASKKRAQMIKRRPTIDMIMGYQSGFIDEQPESTSQQHLIQRTEQANWSDDDDEQSIQPQSSPFDEPMTPSVVVEHATEEEICNDKEMREQEENPFMSFRAATQGNASFINRLYKTQNTSSSYSQGVIRSSHSNHRFNPYSKQ